MIFVLIWLAALLVMIPLAIFFAIAYGVACVIGWIGRTIGVRLGLARARGGRGRGGQRGPVWVTGLGSSGAAERSVAGAMPGDDLRKNVRVRLPRSEE